MTLFLPPGVTHHQVMARLVAGDRDAVPLLHVRFLRVVVDGQALPSDPVGDLPLHGVGVDRVPSLPVALVLVQDAEDGDHPGAIEQGQKLPHRPDAVLSHEGRGVDLSLPGGDLDVGPRPHAPQTLVTGLGAGKGTPTVQALRDGSWPAPRVPGGLGGRPARGPRGRPHG